MSEYGTWLVAGDDQWSDEPTGRVLAYYGSHIYPHDDYERGDVSVCVIPSFCVPGHRGEGKGYEAPAPWIRMGVTNPAEGRPLESHFVCMDVAAVTALRDTLTTWLDLPKTEPKEASA